MILTKEQREEIQKVIQALENPANSYHLEITQKKIIENFPNWINGLLASEQAVREQLEQATELLKAFVKRTAADHSYIHTPEYAKAQAFIFQRHDNTNRDQTSPRSPKPGSSPISTLYREDT